MAKKNKILLALLLVLVMAVSSACFAGDEEIKQPAGVDGDSSVTNDDAGANNDPSGDANNSGNTVEVSVEETVLYDANGIKVTATGFEDGWMGPEIKVLVENNSGKNVLITTDSVSVNGYMMPYASMYAEVAAGKKANESISIMSTNLEQAGIETVAEVQFYLQISDADTWDTLATSDLITVNTSAAGLDQPIDDSGDLVYDSKGIKVVCKGLMQDLIWDGTVVFYMENNSGKNITVYAENVSVNGFMQDVSLWSDLRNGTRIVDGMTIIDLSDLNIDNIDQIENIEFSLRIINADNWDEIATTEAIILSFE